jgi:hypothetical protein
MRREVSHGTMDRVSDQSTTVVYEATTDNLASPAHPEAGANAPAVLPAPTSARECPVCRAEFGEAA